MILIADSGSSKTSWYYSDTEGNPSRQETNGINPFFRDSKDVVQELQNVFSSEIQNNISEIYFYGAGIASEEKSMVVREAFSALFPKAKTEISSDLLAAARATLKHEKGIAFTTEQRLKKTFLRLVMFWATKAVAPTSVGGWLPTFWEI